MWEYICECVYPFYVVIFLYSYVPISIHCNWLVSIQSIYSTLPSQCTELCAGEDDTIFDFPPRGDTKLMLTVSYNV